MKRSLVTSLILGVLAVGCSAPANAEALARSWNVSYSDLKETLVQTNAVGSDAQQSLDTGPLTYGGLRWDDVRYEFDQAGRLSRIKLMTKTVTRAAIKAQMASNDATLWQAVDAVNNGDDEGGVMLCASGSSMTLTYARPAGLTDRRLQPLQLVALNTVAPLASPEDLEVSDFGD